MAKTTNYPADHDSETRSHGESRHSHFEYGSTRGRWEERDDSDFVITSVNVPDRLDTQEAHNRAEAESALPTVGRFHREDRLRAIRWGIALLALALLGWWGYRVVEPMRQATSPAGVAATLGRVLGAPVSVGDTAIRLSPSPRLELADVFVQSGYRLPKVSLLFNWSDAFRALQTAHWVFGEASVAPVELNGQEAMALLNSVRPASKLPAAVTTIRFESLALTDVGLLPGRYEAVIRRSGQQEFSTVALKRLDVEGRVDMEITPAESGGAARFALFASKWPASVGPAVMWDEATAQGQFHADLLQVDSFSVGASFGNINGAAALTRDGGGWQLAGRLRSPDLNLGELIRYAARLNEAEGADARLPLRGVGKVEMTLSGAGATLSETLRQAVASGSGSVAAATFGGLNLGVAATQGSAKSAGGQTRLGDLNFDVQLTRGGVIVRGLSGRAGSLRLSGGFSVDPALKLNGLLRPEVVSPRGTTSAMIQVSGTIAAPTFR